MPAKKKVPYPVPEVLAKFPAGTMFITVLNDDMKYVKKDKRTSVMLHANAEAVAEYIAKRRLEALDIYPLTPADKTSVTCRVTMEVV